MSLKKYAVIVAGGTGSRMGSAMPKQFLMVNGKPILYYSIKSFLTAFDDVQIIIVLPEEHIGTGQEIIDAYFDYSNIILVNGGRTRFHSVQNGLSIIEEESLVFVHDAVRCLVTPELLIRCADDAAFYGSSLPVVESKDSIRMVEGTDSTAVDRRKIKIVQTPQVFHSKLILPAFKGIDYKEHFTDEAAVMEAFGVKVHLTQGEEENIKITYPLDVLLAEEIIRKRESSVR